MTLAFYGQHDTINQLNSKGKKTGYWIKYLDADLNPTDSSSSYFFGYEYYDNGTPVLIFRKDKRNKNYRHSFINRTSAKGNPRVLDGTFVWHTDKDSIPDVIATHKNGLPVNFIVYHQCEFHSRYVSEYLDFTRKYNNTIGSYYYEFEGEKYWYRKVGTKWKSTKVD